jgi:hypothetical protein
MKDMIFEQARFESIPGANTFRVGSKWNEQLKLNEVVRAVDLEGRELGKLQVRGLHFQPLRDALEQHAQNNHGVIDAFAGIARAEAANEYLTNVLQSVYPGVNLNDTTPVTVVEFERNANV